MNNNEAVVALLGNITPIEGADKIVSAQVLLQGVAIATVVVGKDTQEGTKVVYFDSNLCLSDALVTKYPDLARYLAKGNRVRCVKLKGVISNGLAVEVKKFDSSLREGASFTSLNGMELCKKWLPPAIETGARSSKMGKAKNAKKPSRVIPELFHFHVDTQQLARNMHKLNPEDVISISRKIHGTSAGVSHIKVRKELSFFEKVLKRLGLPVQDTEWDYLYNSRTVIKNDAVGKGFYKQDLWTEVGEKLFKGKLHKGESVYYEIVGYLPGTSSFIQKNYDYGCALGSYKIAVYRITQTNDDGVVFEHGWASMAERCKELNVPMVETYYFGRVCDMFADLVPMPYTEEDAPNWRSDFIGALRMAYLEQDAYDNLCKKMPDEGIVLRIEAKEITVFKLKSERFFLAESSAKDEGTVDIEEQEAVDNE